MFTNGREIWWAFSRTYRKDSKMLKRRFAILIGALALALGAGMTASASTTPPPGPPPIAGYTATPAPNAPSGYSVYCNHGATVTCLNNAGYSCSSGTWVEGGRNTDGSNEWVYVTYQSNYGWNIHFADCGNSMCVWQDGTTSSTSQVSMYPCSGSDARDLWKFPASGTSSEISNTYNNNVTCWNSYGEQCQAYHGYVYGNSDWNAYPT